MANPSKAKGDRAELEAVEYICDLVPELVVSQPKRMLGAGRMEDEGDLWVLPDVAIQVRNYKLDNIGQALRSAATDAVAQAANGEKPFALGLVPYPRARKDSVRWIATWVDFPNSVPGDHVLAEFKTVTKALDWVRDDDGPDGYMTYGRRHRIGLLGGRGARVHIAPAEAWFHLYAQARRTGEVNSGAPAHTSDMSTTLGSYARDASTEVVQVQVPSAGPAVAAEAAEVAA